MARRRDEQTRRAAPETTRPAALDAAVRDLVGARMRLTGPRRAILSAVRATDSHPTAEWVHHEVRKRLPRVSLGTVYRNLRRLVEEGLLAEIRVGLSTRFDARLGGHHHFTCSLCGRIFDLDEVVDRRLDARVAARTGFRISHHRIEFYGACSACAPRAVSLAGRGPRSPGRPSPS